METSNIIKSKVCFKSLQSSTIINNLLFDDKSADVHFVFNFNGNREIIPAHKLILTKGSKVFATMFDGRWKEQKEVEIVDADVDVFKEFLQFFYTDEVQVTVQSIPEIMNLANKYDVNECLNVCELILRNKVGLDDICIALDAAILFDRYNLKMYCECHIGKFTKTVFASDSFLRCSRDSLKFILDIDHLSCDQVKVFDACIDWAKRACEKSKTDPSVMSNLKRELGDCLYQIEFALMTPQDIAKCVMKHIGLFELDELEEIVSTMAADVSGTMKKFKISSTGSIKWSEDSKLQCLRQNLNSSTFYIREFDNTSFKVNKTMMFGAISTVPFLRNGYRADVSSYLNGRMTVVESSNSSNGKILLLQPIKFMTHTASPCNYTKFVKDIMVQPHRRYQIQFNFDGTWLHETYFTSYGSMFSEVYFGNNHKVTFVRNEFLPYNNLTNGIISTLYFNAA